MVTGTHYIVKLTNNSAIQKRITRQNSVCEVLGPWPRARDRPGHREFDVDDRKYTEDEVQAEMGSELPDYEACESMELLRKNPRTRAANYADSKISQVDKREKDRFMQWAHQQKQVQEVPSLSP